MNTKDRIALLCFAAVSTALLFDSVRTEIISIIEKILSKQVNFIFWDAGFLHASKSMLVIALAIFGSSFFVEPLLKSLLILGIITSGYFVFMLNSVVNMPVNDDYITLLQFGIKMTSANGLHEKLPFLFEKTGDHQLVFLHGVGWLQLFLTGKLNFAHLIISGNLLLPVIFFVLCFRFFKPDSTSVLCLAVLLFQPGFYDATSWATSISYLGVIAFAIISFHFAQKENRFGYAIAISFASLSWLAFSNGILVFAILLAQQLLQKKWLHFVACTLVFSILFFVLNFTNLNYATTLPSFTINLQTVPFAFCFMGAAFQFGYKIMLPLIAGTSIFILFLLATKHKFYRTNFTVYCCWLFIITSAFITAFFRLSYGFDASISNRYGFFSIIAVMCCLVFVFQHYPITALQRKIILCCSITFHLGTNLFFYPELFLRNQKLESLRNNIINQESITVALPVIPANADSIINKAVEIKIFSLKN